METFKGTKGEWKLKEEFVKSDLLNPQWYTVWSDGFKIAEIDTDRCIGAKENAKLIAAAPELLEALQSMLKIFDRGLPESSIGKAFCDKAKNVINKAL
jgi:hypothetical protein